MPSPLSCARMTIMTIGGNDVCRNYCMRLKCLQTALPTRPRRTAGNDAHGPTPRELTSRQMLSKVADDLQCIVKLTTGHA